jgi:hypothetical protein
LGLEYAEYSELRDRLLRAGEGWENSRASCRCRTAESGAVHLDDGTELKMDLLYWATGWKHDLEMKFRPESAKGKVGLPTS